MIIKLDDGRTIDACAWTGGDVPTKSARKRKLFRAVRRILWRAFVADCGGLDLWECAGTSALDRARIFWNQASLDAWRTCQRAGWAPDMAPEDYERKRAALDVFDAWVDTKRNRRGWASYHVDDIPADIPRVSNDERSALELHAWKTSPPAQYFAYVNEREHVLTTWTGDILGRVEFGREYRDNFGGVRVPVQVVGNNGVRYFGTYYKSAGDYARIRANTGQRAAG